MKICDHCRRLDNDPMDIDVATVEVRDRGREALVNDLFDLCKECEKDLISLMRDTLKEFREGGDDS